MPEEYEDFPLFELHAEGTLRVFETVVPVTVHVEAYLSKPAAVGQIYGPADALFDAFYHQQGTLQIAGIKIPARFRSYHGHEELAFFDTAPLYRALARAAAKRLASGE
jgi:hypothetical protein